MPISKQPKYTKKQLYTRMGMIAFGLWIGFSYVGTRYIIAIDEQDPSVRCINAKLYLIDKWDKKVVRDVTYAFMAMNVPRWEPGALITKYARGVPGDVLSVNDKGAFINDHQVVDGLPLLNRLKKEAKDFTRTVSVPDKQYAFFGNTPTAYDSRYWGFVTERQIVGRTYIIPHNLETLKKIVLGEEV